MIGGVVGIVLEAVDNASGIIKGALEKMGLAAAVSVGGFTAMAIGASLAFEKISESLGRVQIAIDDDLGEITLSLRTFAVDVSRATGESAKGIFAVIEHAAQHSVPASMLESFSAAAVGLSHALGIDLSSAASKLRDALKGNRDELAALIPSLKGVKDGTAALRIVQDIAGEGFDLARDKVATLGGFFTQFKNTMTANMQSLGEAIAPGVKLIVDALRPLLTMFESSGSLFAGVFNNLAAIVAPVISAVVNGLQYIQTALGIVGDSFAGAGDGAQAGMSRVQEIVASVAAFVDHAMRQMAVGILAVFVTVQAAVADWETAWEAIKVAVVLAVKSAVEMVLEAFRSFGEATKPIFGAIAENMATILGAGFDRTLELMTNKYWTWAATLPRHVSKYINEGLLAGLADFTVHGGAIGRFVGRNLKAGLDSSKAAIAEAELQGRLPDFIPPTLKEVPGFSGVGDALKSSTDELREQLKGLTGKLGIGDKLDALLKDFEARLAAGANAQAGKDVKDAIGGLGLLPKDKKDDGKGQTTNLLESRFLTRAPGGLSPEVTAIDKVASEVRNVVTKLEMQQQLQELHNQERQRDWEMMRSIVAVL